MPSSCSVTGCKSNYKSSERVKVFEFPKRGTPLFDQWMKKIPRKDWAPGPRSVVCIQHFRNDQVIKEDTFTLPDGTVKVIPRLRYKLVDGAVPCIFRELPSYLSAAASTSSRRCPDERRTENLAREEQKINDFLEEDKISSFNSLVENITKITKSGWYTLSDENRLTLYQLDEQHLPLQITRSVSVDKNLALQVYLREKKLCSELKFLFPVTKTNEIYVERYSQLENLISWLGNQDCVVDELNTLKVLFGTCVAPSNAEHFGPELYEVLCFLYEQLMLSDRKTAPRYSSRMLTIAFLWWTISPKCYGEILSSRILTLPKERYLRRLSSVLSSPGSSHEFKHQKYLKTKCEKLNKIDRQVTLLIDEIIVRPHISYSSGTLCGISINQKLKRATSIQSFMLTSVYSSYKDVAALLPVHNSTTEELFKWTQNVITFIQNCGFIIVAIITDNNRVNRNMLTRLCGGELQTSIPNPSYEGKIFILFDTVHIIKSVRNNWINQRTSGNTFMFPSIKNTSEMVRVSFSDIIRVYEIEKNSVLKHAPRLTFKALNPNNFERQNVSLCLRIFNETNIAALRALIENSEGTVEFLSTIVNWWKIVNCKSTRKGIEHLDCFEMPFYSIEDERLVYLEEIVSWLETWKRTTLPYKGKKSGKLSEETFCSLTHTTKALKDIIHRLSVAQDKYVLLGKYQSDPIEGRFGQYRQMNGGTTTFLLNRY